MKNFCMKLFVLLLAGCMLIETSVYAAETEQENDIYMYLKPTVQASDDQGQNMSGNTPEVLGTGGFYATQGDWCFYPDSEHDYVLTAENKITHERIQITDFLAANINVVGDTLIFTDVEMTIEEGLELYGTTTRMIYGGNLYRLDGILSLSEDSQITLQQIGEPDKAYYQVTMNKENIFALCGSKNKGGEDWTYSKLDGMGMPLGVISGGEGESIVNSAESNGYIYLEIQKIAENGMNGGYILRIDRDHGTGSMDYIWGYSLRAYGDYIFYLGIEDMFLYVTHQGGANGEVISCCKIRNFEVSDNGLIKGICENNKTNIVITKEAGLHPFRHCAVKQVGEWYNYLERNKSDSKNIFNIGGYAEGESNYISPGPVIEPTEDEKKPSEETKKPSEETKEPGVEDPSQTNQYKSVTPEMAVDMIYTIVKGGELTDEIFAVYNENQKSEFMKYYSEGDEFEYSSLSEYLETSIISLLDGEGLSEQQIADITAVTKGWLEAITYTREVTGYSGNGNEAYVSIHLTKFCDFASLDLSDEILMEYLNGYMEANGYSAVELQTMDRGQLMYEFMMYTCQNLPVVKDVDITFTVFCYKHDILGWVVDPGNEPGKGAQQIFDPQNVGGFPPLTPNSPGGNDNNQGMEAPKPQCPTSNNSCAACIPRDYIYVRQVTDTENLGQFIIRQIKNSIIDMRFDLPLTTREYMKNKEENKYKEYGDYKKVFTGEALPGAIICKDLYLENLQHKPSSFWNNLKEDVKSWFSGRISSNINI